MLRIRPDSALEYLQAVVWLPDGDNILVIGQTHSSHGQIYRYTISSNTWGRVTNDFTDYQNLSITADGRKIVTRAWNNPASLWHLPTSEPGLARQITFGLSTIDQNTGISWTRDGRIVYASDSGGRWEIWMIDADGSNQKQLTQNCAGNDTCSMPFVSPDNHYIAFQATLNGKHNIWRMNLDGSNPVRLTTDGGIAPFVTPDSSAVIYGTPVYANRIGSASTLWAMPIEGGEPKRLNAIAPTSRGALSPDGRKLVFDHYDSGKKERWEECVAYVKTSAEQKCFESCWSPQWAPDGTAFYCVSRTFESIIKQPLNGKREVFLRFAGERVNSFSFSPDHKQLIVARSKPTHDIVALIDDQ